MAQTSEQRLSQLEKAHSRLFNEHNNLKKDFEKLVRILDEKLTSMNSAIFIKPKEDLKVNENYLEEIESIISKSDTVTWKDKMFNNYEIKLKNREQIYTAFISTKYELSVGKRIKFTYGDNCTLKSLKIYE